MNCKRISSWWCCYMIASILFCGCSDQKSKIDVANSLNVVEVSKIDTVPDSNVPDRTLYGKGGSFGMSTFVLVADDGQKYDVTRVSEAGKEGRIFGSLAPGEHYALLLDETGDALEVVLNLKELEAFVGSDYYIYNGEVVLTKNGNREWVDIEELSANAFVANGRGGTRFSYKK